ncbi:amidohydrolase family protein [Amycolatopsis rhabdoformis]|uniref:Amidohydrolase family protein n=1 Tax=Amycolatopsis rhabdoformis TaxID=1448059 RepID=A0ABZ1IKB8_9PSEU|nr:amidohydrolase family protein [Amycolatopsis rhabdoformis]WSE34331.1 amidohydrolase family protein [Amycolatopsis rhabdoformis]
MNRWSDREIDDRLDASARDGRSALRAIDVHSHYLPPSYRRALHDAGITHPDGYHAGVPRWSAQEHLEQMERLGIETAVVSISTPGVVLGGDTDPRRVAAEANDEGAELVRAHPGRFGFYAALALPDVDAALREIDRAVDTLGAWGVSLLTHTDGLYLGDDRLDTVFAELSRRQLPVLVHPTAPATLVPGVMAGWSRSMYEFFFDTTRAVTNLVFSGVLERHPGVRLVIPHAGAALPALAQRIERNVWRANLSRDGDQERLPSFVGSLRRCYFDLAGSVLPYQLPSILSLVDDSRIVYGSDFPYTNAGLGAELNADLRTAETLSSDQKAAFLRHNAAALFPRRAETRGVPA